MVQLGMDVTANAKESNVDEIIDFAIKNLALEFLWFMTKRSTGIGRDFTMLFNWKMYQRFMKLSKRGENYS